MHTWQVKVKLLGRDRHEDAIPIQRQDEPKEGVEIEVPVSGRMVLVRVWGRPSSSPKPEVTNARVFEVEADEIARLA